MIISFFVKELPAPFETLTQQYKAYGCHKDQASALWIAVTAKHYTFSCIFLPSRPVGLTRRTIIRIEKTIASAS